MGSSSSCNFFRHGPNSPRFVGRCQPTESRLNCELTSLAELACDAAAGHGGLYIVEGEAGVGKTRLLVELEKCLADPTSSTSNRIRGLLDRPLPMVRVSAATCRDRGELIQMLVTSIASVMQHTSLRLRERVPRRTKTWAENLIDSFDKVVATVGVPGIVAAGVATGLLGAAHLLAFVCSLVAFRLAAGVIERAQEGAFSWPEAWPEVVELLKRLNSALRGQKYGLVIAVDQWDDLTQLPEAERSRFPLMLSALNDAICGMDECHLLLIVGGRSGRVNQVVGVNDIRRLPVTRLPRSELMGLLQHPEAPGSLAGPRLSRPAAESLLAHLCEGSSCNLAYVRLVAELAADRAIEERLRVIEPDSPANWLLDSIEHVLERRITLFRESQGASELVDELLMSLSVVNYAGFTPDDVGKAMGRSARRAEFTILLDEFARFTGLLDVRTGPASRLYRFSHLSYQDALERVVVGGSDDLRAWREEMTAAMMAVRIGHADGIHRGLGEIPAFAWRRGLEMFPQQLLTEFARGDNDTKIAAIRTMSAIASGLDSASCAELSLVEDALEEALHSNDEDLRTEALRGVPRMPSPSRYADAALRIALSLGQDHEREAAIIALRPAVTDEMLQPLLRALQREPSESIRRALVGTLAVVSRDRLILALRHDQRADGSLSDECLFELFPPEKLIDLPTDIRDRVFISLDEALAAGSAELQRRALRTLGKVKTRGALESILNSYESLSHQSRSTALLELASIGIRDNQILVLLLDAIESRDESLRSAAVWAMKQLKLANAAYLARAISRETNPRLLAEMIEVLAEIAPSLWKSPMSKEGVTQLDPSEPVAAVILAQLPISPGGRVFAEEDPLGDRLGGVLESARDEYKKLVLETIARRRSPAALKHLERAIQASSSPIASPELAVYAKLVGTKSLPFILTAIRSSLPACKAVISDIAEATESAELSRELASMLLGGFSTSHEYERILSEALEKSGVGAASAEILAGLQSPDNGIRLRAARVIAVGLRYFIGEPIRSLVEETLRADGDTFNAGRMRPPSPPTTSEHPQDTEPAAVTGIDDLIRDADQLEDIIDSPNWRVQWDASDLIARLDKSVLALDEDAFESALSSDRPALRHLAAIAVPDRNQKSASDEIRRQAAAELVSWLSGMAHSRLVSRSLLSLAKIAPRRTLEIVDSWHADLSSELREIEVFAAARLGEAGTERLRSIVATGGYQVLEYCVKALEDVHIGAVVDELRIRAIYMDRRSTRVAVLERLASLESAEETWAWLLSLAKEGFPKGREEVVVLAVAEFAALLGGRRVPLIILNELVGMLDQIDESRIRAALMALTEYGARRGLVRVRALLSHPSSLMRARAITLLSVMPGIAPREALVSSLFDVEDGIRAHAAEALASMPALESISDRLSDRSADRISQCVHRVLGAYAHEESSLVRSLLPDVLVCLGRKLSIAAARDMLNQCDPATRPMSCAIMTRIGAADPPPADTRALVRELLAGLDSAFPYVRKECASVLLSYPSAEVVRRLLDFALQGGHDTLKQCEEALTRIDRGIVESCLEEQLSNESDEIRRSVIGRLIERQRALWPEI